MVGSHFPGGMQSKRAINTAMRYRLSPEQQSEGTAACYFCLGLELVSIS